MVTAQTLPTHDRKDDVSMDRSDIARAIAEELLDDDILDIHNFSGDAEGILGCVQGIILKHLQDYLIISGSLLQ